MTEALYRKYRPQVFEDVVGQEPIERTLKNAIENNKVSHAYLFTGPRGTGKTTTARLLAKALLCQNGPTPEPDGTCEDCRLIADGTHPDVYELDAASRTGVENVREEIISRVQYAPTRGRSKVYIIDEVHMLSTAAFNALLKTLEEPPAHVVFILCTTDPQKVPETIHSRCQRFDFHRIAPESIVTRLGAICVAEDVEFEGEALDLIAQKAEGGLRNALTALEQVIAFENGQVTLEGAERMLGSIDSSDLGEIMALIGTRDVAGCFRWVGDYVETGADLAQFVRDMAEHVRNLYILTLAGDDAALEVPEPTRRALATELQWFGPERASRLLGVLGDLIAELKTSSNPRLSFEIALTRMVRPDSDLSLEALAERIEAIESGYSSAAHVLPSSPVSQIAASSDVFRSEAPQPSLHTSEDAASESEQDAPVAAEEVGTSNARSDTDSFAVGASDLRSEGCAASEREQGASVAADEVGTSNARRDTEVSAVAASVGEGLANPATLQRLWQVAFSDIKKTKQAYGVLFLNTKVHYDEAADLLRIAFPEESTFAFKAVQNPEVEEVVAASVEKAFGRPLRFCYVQGNASAVEAAPKPAAVAAAEPELVAAPATRPVPEPEPASAPASRPVPEPRPAPEFETASAAAEPAPASKPEPESEPVPAPQAQSAPEPDPVPYEDEVPLDVYEEYVPADASPSAVDPAPKEESAPAATAPAAQTSDLNDVQAMLQNGFGGDIKLEEVDE